MMRELLNKRRTYGAAHQVRFVAGARQALHDLRGVWVDPPLLELDRVLLGLGRAVATEARQRVLVLGLGVFRVVAVVPANAI
jgi:hypothetical protein